MIRTSRISGYWLTCGLMALGGWSCVACSERPSPEATVAVSRAPLVSTFRVGSSGYGSSDDLSISNQGGGNGVTDRSAGQLLSWKKSGTDAYEIMSFIRFNALALPPGSQVTSAQLTLTFENWWTGFTLRGYYLKNAWNAASGASLGWLNRDTGLTWDTPGAKGSGTDIVAGKSFSNSSWTGNGDEVRTFDLDPSIVQGWVDNPATNQGIVLVNNESDDKYLRIYSSEDPTVSRRPLLSITYSSAPSCVTTGVNAWTNSSFSSNTGTFTASFDAKPSAAPTDAVIGLSLGAASAFSNLATIVRFNANGSIDARNGGAYGASSVPYVANANYHFRLVVDVSAHTYSAFVTPPGGSEQSIGTNFAFRSEQSSVSSLNNVSTVVDTDGQGTLALCNFAISSGGGSGDTTPPTVALTAPSNGATVSGAVTATATANDDLGVAGVTFLVDGAAYGTEDTTSPYSQTIDTTALSAGVHQIAARARDTAGNTATSPGAAVTVSNSGGGVASHPRIFLDGTTLATLRSRAQANGAGWPSLRAACESYIGGNTRGVCYPPPDTYPPECQPYPNLPDVGEGYQGASYLEAVVNLGLCYLVGDGWDSQATAWANRGAAILDKMTEFTHYERDSNGYGIRNYGVGMALGYDYLYAKLPSDTKTRVINSLNAWLNFFDSTGLTRNQPHANYFAGYYATKAYASLATEGDNSSAPAQWNDFLERLHRGNNVAPIGAPPQGGVQPYYTDHLTGGGWYEGWQYGNLAVQNMSLPSLAALTAKNVDLISDPQHPYRYPLESAMHVMQFSWPSRDSLDDRDTLHGGGACRSNAQPYQQLLAVLSTLLAKWNDPLAPQFHKFAREVRGIVAPTTSPWAEFLFWDDGASELDYSNVQRSYRATNYVAMRSDWSPTATWASLRATGYVVASESTEQFPDPGALAIVRGNLPFLVTPGFLHACYGSTSTEFGQTIHDEIYGTTQCDNATPRNCWDVPGPQRIFNTFYNGTSPPILGFTSVDDLPNPTTRIASFDDRGGYVISKARDLEDVFRTAAKVSSWSRDVVYVRPSVFVVYDRTSVSDLSGDQHMNWHFSPTPVAVSAPSAGAKRYDVSDGFGFKGTMTTLLPANASTSAPINVFDSNKLYRIEVRPSNAATDQRWLTVFETATGAPAVKLASTIATTKVNGALLSGSGTNIVVLFGTGAPDALISGNVTFSEPAVATTLVITDLPPNTGYSVSATVSGGNHTVTVAPGSGFITSATGTLYVNIAANGSATPGS